ncbi:hypothetical protein AVEN_95978-1 [Araneus ventricosus]|uniref:DEK C-terminal domain-containing protein n=1 Tax=Araneus ventricosus TaxID=182803 RepID=A0A4Y2B4I9_ARAVE|nr:hypothetical protein AVEN_95978-1 [Araneus ventricosus]
MTTLNDIQEISTALKNCKTEKIKILHKFLFGSLGDRSNRKRIREFIGFDFQVDSEEFEKKLESVDELFSLDELITICNILNISFDGSKPEVSKRILSFLCNLEALAETSRADFDESDVDEETANDFEKENKKAILSEVKVQIKEILPCSVKRSVICSVVMCSVKRNVICSVMQIRFMICNLLISIEALSLRILV